ncbi:MAG TPA: M23 family metallopeptidase [Pyrinomonadaceae bacterium]|nr:M23 family metallopeptidase [Pyrinomonadaceae bacterium]
MSAPNLTVTAEPAESGSLVYGALAARSSNEPANGQFSLVLTITNNEAASVRLNQVKVSFVGPPSVNVPAIAANLTILPSQTLRWFFGILGANNNVILPVPAPGAVKLKLFFDNFSDAAELDMTLGQYQSPATDGGYSFPARSADLSKGEYWTGLSAAHGAAGGGTQLFAYDLLIRAYDSSTNGWPTSKPGSDNTLNENYYMWGKPIYAMADGIVVQLLDGMAANTPPALPSPTPNPVEGNHFYIQHGDDLALYAHFQAGTLNAALTSGPNPDGTGATVTQGELLGLAGNSGNSSEPHLHIQVNRTTTPWGGPTRPLPFNDIHVLDLSAVPDVWPPNDDAPWNLVSAQALPSVNSAIWPGALKKGKKNFGRWVGPLAWAWIIFIGGLMITPGGVSCPACGWGLTNALGIVSIVLGVLGFASRVVESRATQRIAGAQIDAKVDLHS